MFSEVPTEHRDDRPRDPGPRIVDDGPDAPIMPPLTRILCLVSTEPSTSAALRHAVHQACALGAGLYAVPRREMPADAVRRAARRVASSECRNALDLHVEAPVSSSAALVETLRSYVQDLAVDLVVTGTPTDRGPIPPLADPPTQALLEGLPCSVLAAGEIAPAPPRRFLLPTDLSDATPPALDCATVLAPLYDASIELLHVIEATPYVALTPVDRLSLSGPSFPERRARRHLDAFLEAPDAPVPIEPHVAYGDPVDQISRFVNRHDVDLMVLPARRERTPPRSSLGSVTDRVLRRVACPVLLARPRPSS
ncbi:MAG: universal stress protein [Salinibacter sp.]